jgi:hypothetical protein
MVVAVALERRDLVQAFRQLTYDIVRSGGAAMTFTEAVMYDETAMKSKVSDDAELVAPRNSSAQRAVVSADSLGVQAAAVCEHEVLAAAPSLRDVARARRPIPSRRS